MSQKNIYLFLCLFFFIEAYAQERERHIINQFGGSFMQILVSATTITSIKEVSKGLLQSSFLRLNIISLNLDEKQFYHDREQYSILEKKNRQNIIWAFGMTVIAFFLAMIAIKVSLINRRLKCIHIKYIEQNQRLREWLKELRICERQTRKRLCEIEEQMKQQQIENKIENEPILSKFHHSGEWRPIDEDWKMLTQIVDKTYNGFTYRLKIIAPSLEECDIRACLLLKIGVRRRNMAPLLFMTESGVSMHHVRLYKKITGQTTKSSIPLHDFIRDF